MYWQTRQNKYGNKSATYNGHTYHSIKEAAYAQELDLRVKGKDIKSWERQVRIPLDVNGYHIADYVIDFVITHNDKTKEYVEVKGFETQEWRFKWKLFEALYTDQFQKNGWTMTVVKDSKMTRHRPNVRHEATVRAFVSRVCTVCAT